MKLSYSHYINYNKKVNEQYMEWRKLNTGPLI
jgi:hypothetical protein